MNPQIPISFYETLLEFVKKGGYSPPLGEKLEMLHSSPEFTFSFNIEYLQKTILKYFNLGSTDRMMLLVEITKFAFKDLIPFFDQHFGNPDGAPELFKKFTKLARTQDDLYVMMLKPDREYPYARTYFSDNPQLLTAVLWRSVSPPTIHNFREDE